MNTKVYISKTVLIIFLSVCVLFAIYFFFRPGHPLPDNCSQLKLKGEVNIGRENVDYNPALDRDHDGIACEK